MFFFACLLILIKYETDLGVTDAIKFVISSLANKALAFTKTRTKHFRLYYVPMDAPIGTGVSSYSLHPGVIRTGLGRHIESWFPMMKTVMTLPSMLLMKTPWQGAQTSIYCAVTEGLERKSGCYFR